MDFLTDFLKEVSHQVSHHFQEDLGIRPLRITTGKEGKVYASTVGKNFSFECFLFPSQIFWVRSGRTVAERGPEKASAKKVSTERVVFPARNR